jgi:uncharacterized membrane protein
MVTAEMIRAREEAARDVGRGDAVVNVGETERFLSKIGGGVLVGAGLLRGGLKGTLMAGLGGLLLYRGTTGHCSLFQVLGASTAEGRGPSDSVPAQAGVRVEESIIIDRSPEELYRFWLDVTNHPRFEPDIVSVTPLNGNRSHWVAQGPLGVRLEWDAEAYNERPFEMIAWRSLDGGQVQTAGSVHFQALPAGRGTEVRVNQKFNPPAGKVGVAIASLLGHDPAATMREALRRLKQIMETGEVPTVAGQPSGRG